LKERAQIRSFNFSWRWWRRV